jgi:hypothetical protein
VEASTAGRHSVSDDDSGYRCDQHRVVFWVEIVCLYSEISVTAAQCNSVDCRMLNECNRCGRKVFALEPTLHDNLSVPPKRVKHSKKNSFWTVDTSKFQDSLSVPFSVAKLSKNNA